ncbi:hypothetical protein SIAM614_16612 [Stappia aggregata IAM 12614]|uniref:Uncharacterized protein n=1 Tax=Roseibium aggregatum (strain ATCC 25650 / DSM 13394 / JCM 20685 / NBRC 16684 / NCIMB 2208 / IAM 12614 / B1) TaxID=384765 RepID=A0NWR4_ROSAI|nr:hypothetical protein SIAM614_16612 [Stappia aggregata IAM 12614] [Roseibium aggregatum IAM 12614]
MQAEVFLSRQLPFKKNQKTFAFFSRPRSLKKGLF